MFVVSKLTNTSTGSLPNGHCGFRAIALRISEKKAPLRMTVWLAGPGTT